MPVTTAAVAYGPPEPGAPQTAFASVSDWTVSTEDARPEALVDGVSM